jgi:Peptidase S46
MLTRSRLFLAFLFASCNAAYAVEGMWQPHQLQELAADVQAKGLQLDPKSLGNLDAFPLNAVVGLGFCTASFVSPMGLVVTNHHCAYGAIQFNSKPERNLLRDGFLAKTIGDELPGDPTLRVYVTEAITDVSAQIRKDLPIAGRSAFDLIDARQKALVASCEKGGGYRCDVYVFHGGASYYLVKQMEIRDVRLVYNPSESIGKFGGDTDNWIWPRHTADFSFIRAYVGPNGKPADYSSSNVPYRPKSYLKVSATGVKENDFVMIAGYPGRTNRYRLAQELDDAVNFTFPTLIARNQKVIDIIAEQSEGRPEAALKYAATVASLKNGLKNFQGNRDGFAKLPLVQQKADEEQTMLAWMRKNAPNGEAGYTQLTALLAQARAVRNRDQVLSMMRQSGIYQAAFDLYRINAEREKPDAKREYGYQQRDEVRIQGRLSSLDKRWDAKVDRALTEYIWRSYLALEASERVPEIDAWLGPADGLNAKLDALFAQTKLGDASERVRLFKAGRKSLDRSTDPALQMAAALMPAWLKLEDQLKTRNGIESRLRPIWMDARIAYASSLGKPLYPDANNSLRVTYGNVMGYSPRDALNYAPFTSLEGIVEKHTGQGEFDATQKQLDAIKAKRFGDYAANGTVPVNFISDLDITGGNSGSPTLNGKGELVGLAFDGNYEAISSGWVFNPKLTRAIHVDSRYMLWLMQEVDGANNLIKEMVITK